VIRRQALLSSSTSDLLVLLTMARTRACLRGSKRYLLFCASSDGRNRLSANLGYFDPRWTSSVASDVPAANTNGESHEFVFHEHYSTASKSLAERRLLADTGEKAWFTQSDRFETVWEATECAKELSGIDG